VGDGALGGVQDEGEGGEEGQEDADEGVEHLALGHEGGAAWWSGFGATSSGSKD